MSWYSKKNHVGDTIWYTKRNESGVYFQITQPVGTFYRLLVNGWADSDHETLEQAQAAAERGNTMYTVIWDDHEGNRHELLLDTLEDAEIEAAALREKFDYVKIRRK